MVLFEELHEVLKPNLALDGVDLAVDLPQDLVAGAIRLAFGHRVAVADPVPYLLPFDLVLPYQHLPPVPDVPVGLRPLVPQHGGHLKFSSCHSVSLEWP